MHHIQVHLATKTRHLCSLFVLFSILLSACADQPEWPTIRVGTNPWPGYALAHLAQDLGYFAQQGIQVQIKDFTSLADSRRAFEQGWIDIFGATPVEILLSAQKSQRHPLAFYVVDWSQGADVLIARAPRKNMQDLRHQRIGVEAAALDIFVLHLALQTANMQIEDIQLVPLNQGEILQAWAQNQVDAVVSYPPVSLQLQNTFKDTYQVFSSAQTPKKIVDLWVTHQEMAQTSPQQLAAFVRALTQATEYIHTHPQQALTWFTQHFHLTPTEVQDSLSGLQWPKIQEQAGLLAPQGEVVQSLQMARQSLQTLGILTPTNMLNTTWVTGAFVPKVPVRPDAENK